MSAGCKRNKKKGRTGVWIKVLLVEELLVVIGGAISG